MLNPPTATGATAPQGPPRGPQFSAQAEIGTAQPKIPVNSFTPSEMAVLRKSAANWKGSALPESVSARLKLAFTRFGVLRNKRGQVAGFGREGFVLTPRGAGLYTWHEERQRQAHING